MLVKELLLELALGIRSNPQSDWVRLDLEFLPADIKDAEYGDHCQVVSDATDTLYEKVIPKFAFALAMQFGVEYDFHQLET